MSVGDLFFHIQSVTFDTDPAEYQVVSTRGNQADI
jgi:hypothetical protein